jgi:hypothetical protein
MHKLLWARGTNLPHKKLPQTAPAQSSCDPAAARAALAATARRAAAAAAAPTRTHKMPKNKKQSASCLVPHSPRGVLALMRCAPAAGFVRCPLAFPPTVTPQTPDDLRPGPL